MDELEKSPYVFSTLVSRAVVYIVEWVSFVWKMGHATGVLKCLWLFNLSFFPSFVCVCVSIDQIYYVMNLFFLHVSLQHY